MNFEPEQYRSDTDSPYSYTRAVDLGNYPRISQESKAEYAIYQDMITWSEIYLKINLENHNKREKGL